MFEVEYLKYLLVLTQLNSTGHVTLTAKRDREGKKSKSLFNIPSLI